MKITACFNVMFDVEVPDEIVEKARECCEGRGSFVIEQTELFKKIRNAPEFKQIFTEGVDGEITGIYTPDPRDPFFDEVIWEE